MARNSELIISDHALLRWLERCHGIDVEFFRRALLAECKSVGVGVSTISTGGTTYIIRNGLLATVQVGKR